MSRSTRLRTRTAGPERSRSSKGEKEDEDLDTYGLVEEKGGRPFQLIESLPCSLEVPKYSSTLTHALSVRDSAVLYSSMLSSRRTWISSEMFDILWSKQYLSASEKERLEQEGIDPESVDASAAREKMHKLCDCVMVGGPHTFSVRLFILKNEEIEKKWNDAIEEKKRSKLDRKNRELEAKKKRQEERKQQQWIKKQEKEQQGSTTATTGAAGASVATETRKQPIKRRSRKEETTQTQRSRSQTPRQKKVLPQSTDDQKMITNLNLMAQKNSELNSLMIIVAGGRASAKQVEEFKKYIEKARKMPVPPGWKPIAPVVPPATQKQKAESAQRGSEKEDSVAAPAQAAKSLGTPQVKIEDPSQISRENTAAPTTGEPRQKRKYTKRKTADTPTEPEDKSMQLTTFQQKYMHNADIVFEYVENPNKRFSFPKDAILEPLEDGESYLMSWIHIHNRKELEKYKEKKKNVLAKRTKSSESGDDTSQETAEKDDYEIFEDPDAPDPLYTSMTVKFSNIHKKFQPIMINSVNPAEKVQKRMTSIIARGTRLSGYNLWFQLDAYDDTALAESLRCDLKDYEAGFRSKRHRKQL